MKARPILMCGEMVRAILAGKKTQTRRTMKMQPVGINELDSRRKQKRGDLFLAPDKFPTGDQCNLIFAYAEGPGSTRCLGMQNFCEEFSPYGKPGDHLWVRETFQNATFATGCHPVDNYILYRATDPDWECQNNWKWKPSIFMPRSASRITLEITGLRVQRLREISAEEAEAEGCGMGVNDESGGPVARYARLWESINGAGSLFLNPWVWVVEFKRVVESGGGPPHSKTLRD